MQTQRAPIIICKTVIYLCYASDGLCLSKWKTVVHIRKSIWQAAHLCQVRHCLPMKRAFSVEENDICNGERDYGIDPDLNPITDRAGYLGSINKSLNPLSTEIKHELSQCVEQAPNACEKCLRVISSFTLAFFMLLEKNRFTKIIRAFSVKTTDEFRVIVSEKQDSNVILLSCKI
ncbi:hypothetical protein BD560DRAFT_488696 [Blakeslea trispora]|nr:hypothetical protein BD560DRAFT_488696 [Blakeslea trispora]